MSKHVEFFSGLTNEQQIAVLEAARWGLLTESVLDNLDLADDEVTKITTQLDRYLAGADENIKFTLPIISVDRQARKIAICDEFAMVRPFRPYTFEVDAIAEAKAWIAKHTEIQPQIVYPVVRSIRAS